MQPPSPRISAIVWLELARGDSVGAQALAGHGEVPSRLCAYCCQQAVEKAIKGAIVLRGVAPSRVHDLDALAAQAEGLGLAAPVAADTRRGLSQHAVTFRYEAVPTGDPHRADLAGHLAAAQACVAWLEALIAATPE